MVAKFNNPYKRRKREPSLIPPPTHPKRKLKPKPKPKTKTKPKLPKRPKPKLPKGRWRPLGKGSR